MFEKKCTSDVYNTKFDVGKKTKKLSTNLKNKRANNYQLLSHTNGSLTFSKLIIKKGPLRFMIFKGI